MDSDSLMLGLVLGAFFVVLLIGFIMLESDVKPIAQMICDEQYGKDKTIINWQETKRTKDSWIIACDAIEKTEEFDGGYTKLIEGD
jgi:hypothetical protein